MSNVIQIGGMNKPATYQYINNELSKLFKKYHRVSRMNEYLDESIFKVEKCQDNNDTLIKYSKTKIKQLGRTYNTNDISPTINIYMNGYVHYILENYVTSDEYAALEDATKMSYKMLEEYIVYRNFFEIFVFPTIGNFIFKI